jgi:hypothetical protein
MRTGADGLTGGVTAGARGAGGDGGDGLGTEILGSGELTGAGEGGGTGPDSRGVRPVSTISRPAILITCVLAPPGTVPHGGPNPPDWTVTGSDEVNRPEVTETVVVPLLYAQKSPEVDECVVLPLALSFGNDDPGPLGTTKSPTTGSELLNE